MTRHGADTVENDYKEDEDCYFLIACSKPSEKEIRQDATEKVMDKLIDWMEGRYDLPALREKIKELRKGDHGRNHDI